MALEHVVEEGDLAQRQEAIKTLVEPLKQQLEVYQTRLQQSETAQSSTLGEVKKQLELLSQQNLLLTNETQQFRMVLHSNQARGKWGEETLRRVVADAKSDARELFRRICFNALISNLDDHPRNHAILAKEREWKLSPAYDLTPSVPVSIEHRDLAMECGDKGRYANAKNILSQHARFLLSEEEAQRIVNDMKAQVQASWYETLRASGVTEKDAEAIRGAFVYPGFSL